MPGSEFLVDSDSDDDGTHPTSPIRTIALARTSSLLAKPRLDTPTDLSASQTNPDNPDDSQTTVVVVEDSEPDDDACSSNDVTQPDIPPIDLVTAAELLSAVLDAQVHELISDLGVHFSPPGSPTLKVSNPTNPPRLRIRPLSTPARAARKVPCSSPPRGSMGAIIADVTIERASDDEEEDADLETAMTATQTRRTGSVVVNPSDVFGSARSFSSAGLFEEPEEEDDYLDPLQSSPTSGRGPQSSSSYLTSSSPDAGDLFEP
ncbi:hypothetical protein HDU93_006376, partial [Gonapodya sp. JEL0774]